MYRGIRTMLAGLFAVLCLGGLAVAADLPSRQSPAVPVFAQAYKAPFSWAGLYVGVNAGYGFGDKTLESVTYAGTTYPLAGLGFDRSADANGVTVGATIGYNFQLNNGVVLGVEGDLNWADFDGSRDVFGVATVGGKVDYFGTARVRVGYAFDRFLPYVTGGAYWQHSKANVSVPFFGYDGSAKDHTFGWVVGAGVEYAFSDNWSVKGEYLYARVKDTSYSFATPIGVVGAKVENEQHIVRAGLNYRF